MIEEVTPSMMMEQFRSSEIKAGTYEFLDQTAIKIIEKMQDTKL